MDRSTIILIGIVIILILYVTHLENNINKFEQYYYKTEAVLDSVNNVCEDFADNVLEEDYYWDYEKAREEVQRADNLNK
jgi:cell shape-determining protein MreC